MNEAAEAGMHRRFYLDDLRVGQRFKSGSQTLEADRMKAFAAEFDPQAFHLDEAAAMRTVFKGLAASGWHTAAVTMRLLVDGGLPIAEGLIGVGGEIAWPRPTRPGDVLRVETEIVEIAPSRTRPDRGIVTIRCETRNHKEDIVQTLLAKLEVPRRAAAANDSIERASQ
jgi:acyl dehydratase